MGNRGHEYGVYLTSDIETEANRTGADQADATDVT
jgi:hypothetical protein